MSEYMDEPGQSLENSRAGTSQNNRSTTATAPKKGTLETKGPEKNKSKKVLHPDGSFADLPYNNQPGGGSNEGTVGIGT